MPSECMRPDGSAPDAKRHGDAADHRGQLRARHPAPGGCGRARPRCQSGAHREGSARGRRGEPARSGDLRFAAARHWRGTAAWQAAQARRADDRHERRLPGHPLRQAGARAARRDRVFREAISADRSAAVRRSDLRAGAGDAVRGSCRRADPGRGGGRTRGAKSQGICCLSTSGNGSGAKARAQPR